MDMVQDASERDALLGDESKRTKKRFYRARPLWCVSKLIEFLSCAHILYRIVPFAIVAALSVSLHR